MILRLPIETPTRYFTPIADLPATAVSNHTASSPVATGAIIIHSRLITPLL